jgi:hypothetical protein
VLFWCFGHILDQTPYEIILQNYFIRSLVPVSYFLTHFAHIAHWFESKKNGTLRNYLVICDLGICRGATTPAHWVASPKTASLQAWYRPPSGWLHSVMASKWSFYSTTWLIIMSQNFDFKTNVHCTYSLLKSFFWGRKSYVYVCGWNEVQNRFRLF